MIDIIIILIIHWVADFILQSRWMGNNKSKELKPLFAHTLVYSSCWIVLYPILGTNVFWFMLITFVTHTFVDYFTSKASAWAYLKSVNPFVLLLDTNRISAGDELQPMQGQAVKVLYKIDDSGLGYKYLVTDLKQNSDYMHLMWSIIGFDQLLHAIQLILTYTYL